MGGVLMGGVRKLIMVPRHVFRGSPEHMPGQPRTSNNGCREQADWQLKCPGQGAEMPWKRGWEQTGNRWVGRTGGGRAGGWADQQAN
jgi:hypothetical protein